MRKRLGIMLCKPFDEKRLAKWEPPYIVQPKLDGDRCRAIFDSVGNVSLLSSEGNRIESVPHIVEQLRSMKLREIELDGELYAHGKPHNEIYSIVSRSASNIRYDSESISLHLFDLVAPGTPQKIRLLGLKHLLADAPENIVEVPSLEAYSLNQLMKTYDKFIEQGYEGFVVRHELAPYERSFDREVRSSYMMKFKPKKQDVYKIAGYSIEIDKNGVPKEGLLGTLICASSIADWKHIGLVPPKTKLPSSFFGVGSGLHLDERREFWKVKEGLVGKFLLVKYQHLTEKHVPRFPVFGKVLTEEEILQGRL